MQSLHKYRFGALLLLVLVAGLPSLAGATTLPDFSQLVKKARPSVVNISTSQTIKVTRSNAIPMPFPDQPPNSPFNQFFRHFFQAPGGRPGMEEHRQSLGSGFILSKNGYILTNAHVVKDADQILVRLNDNREKAAKLVGMDERTDVALLKIDADNLTPAVLGDSDKVDVGDWVLAIGSPFGFDYSATQGIVSALGRSLPSDAYVPFIQTDAAVNPGNSGGPLFDTQGEVVGINSQIYSNTGGYMGLSFAIPINVAKQVAQQLKATGHAAHGWLGVLIQPVTQDLARSFDLDEPSGALIARVEPNSPAAQAGLKAGDIVLEYNGKKLDTSGTLPPLVGATAVGEKVPLKILRQGKQQTLTVTIRALPGKQQLAAAEHTSGPAPLQILHLRVADLNAAQRRDLDIGKDGVLVQQVGNGPAAKAGIRPGDVLLQIDNRDVTSTEQLATLLPRLPHHKPLAVLLMRNRSPLFLAITIS